MATAYTLTLPAAAKGPGKEPAPYKITCGHWHRTPSAASCASGRRCEVDPESWTAS